MPKVVRRPLRRLKQWTRYRLWGAGLLSLLVMLSCWMGSPDWAKARAATEPSQPPVEETKEPTPTLPSEWVTIATNQAEVATTLAQTARTAEDWDGVVTAWTDAIATLQAIPPTSPQRLFAQRQVREYVKQLTTAQQRAASSSLPVVFPPLGSTVLDEQIAAYLSYIATVGIPDVLIVGSSRALQGIDPQALQQALARQGYNGVKVFNLGVNGATAQVVNFVLQQVLSPEQWPKLVIWGDGSRAFNSARADRTFSAIVNSPGYQALVGGDRPGWTEEAMDDVAVPIRSGNPSAMDAYGFLSLDRVFEPDQYYQQYPRVAGRYDGDYQPFDLAGVQTLALRSVAAFAQQAQIPLVVVNLPLSREHLDPFRLEREREFQAFLRRQANDSGFVLVDVVQRWSDRTDFFFDPSHLNKFGATAVGQYLATAAQIPWSRLMSTSPPNPDQVSTE